MQLLFNIKGVFIIKLMLYVGFGIWVLALGGHHIRVG